MLLAAVFSALVAGCLVTALALTWRAAKPKCGEARSTENVAALFFGLAILLLVVAAIFWLRYLIFGPIGEWAVEIYSDGEVHR